ncbi:MAG: polyhydroxyalkanoate depolymerase [Pseudomonadota bacterium]
MTVLYHWYELAHAALKPARFAASATKFALNAPFNPLTYSPWGRHVSAVCEVFERITRRYEKPRFCIGGTTTPHGLTSVREETVWQKPFCRLVRFVREAQIRPLADAQLTDQQQTDTQLADSQAPDDPRILLVAPMSGHYATLLRGTVEALLPTHDVYITDWQDARDVPIGAGSFDLNDYIDYVREMISLFDGDVHVFAVCQPSVPVLAAVSLMEADDDPRVPRSMILAGGPVDTRISQTEVNRLAESKGTDWFEKTVISIVPWMNAGAGRAVYPGFIQLTGFMTMNLDRHIHAHGDLFRHMVTGDGESAAKHRLFYDEYLAVMDLTAEFYLQTVDAVFVQHSLPKGEMMHRGQAVNPACITRTALMTIEGERDDITGIGQCAAAHTLADNIPAERRTHYVCPKVGHYGVFNGSRFRNDIVLRIGQFVMQNDHRAEHLPVAIAHNERAPVFASCDAASQPSAPHSILADDRSVASDGAQRIRVVN